jgi:hypothetical protein
MRTYFFIKAAIFGSLVVFFVGAIMQNKLDRWWNYIPVNATVQSVDVECIIIGSSPIDYGVCTTENAEADRKTSVAVTYQSPADDQQHKGVIVVTSSADMTPVYKAGQSWEILAHSKQPYVIQRACQARSCDL